MAGLTKLQKAIQDHVRLLDDGRKCYQQAGALLETIVAEAKPGKPIELPGGRSARVIDMFGERTRLTKTVFMDRYRVEIAESV